MKCVAYVSPKVELDSFSSKNFESAQVETKLH